MSKGSNKYDTISTLLELVNQLKMLRHEQYDLVKLKACRNL